MIICLFASVLLIVPYFSIHLYATPTSTLHILRNQMIVARRMLFLSAGRKSKASLFNLVVPMDQ